MTVFCWRWCNTMDGFQLISPQDNHSFLLNHFQWYPHRYLLPLPCCRCPQIKPPHDTPVVTSSDNSDASPNACWEKCSIMGNRYRTCSSPRRTFFLHALSFECTSKLCITFLNQFSAYFHIKKMHNTILSLNCVVRYYFSKIFHSYILTSRTAL